MSIFRICSLKHFFSDLSMLKNVTRFEFALVTSDLIFRSFFTCAEVKLKRILATIKDRITSEAGRQSQWKVQLF